MTFEQLKYFVQTYRLRSISLAADALFISRQVLSRSLNNLEKELNTKLFLRSVAGVTPTEAGEALYLSANKILEEQAFIVEKLNPSSCAVNSNMESKKEFTLDYLLQSLQTLGKNS